MAVCSRCGREMAPYQRYCQYCGEALDAPSEGTPAAVKVATAVAYGRILVRSSSTDEESGDLSGEEREYTLDGRDIAIGRSPSCDISLSGDQLASRRHALLRFKNDRYTIVDLGSSNGTYVNDEEIREETVLHDGDYIKIGGHEMLFSTSPAGPGASVAGERLSQPLPHTPLGETNPSVEAIALPLQQAPAETAANNASAPAPFASETSGPSAGESPASEAGEPPVYTADAFAPAGDEVSMISLDETQAADELHLDAANAPAEPPQDAEAAEPAGAADEQHGDDELETLRMQLSQISAALARRAEESARSSERLRVALVEVRDQLRAALGPSFDGSPDTASESTSELITIARQAAENPRHLDYVTRLAERASDIADTLEARPAAEPDATLRATVEGLVARLDELLA